METNQQIDDAGLTTVARLGYTGVILANLHNRKVFWQSMLSVCEIIYSTIAVDRLSL